MAVALERLEREKRSLAQEVDSLRDEMATMEERLRGLKSVKEARDKQMEIQTLLETNLQTLESRCELLEMQNDSLKKEKE